MALAAGVMLYTGRGTTFFYDDWDYVDTKYGGGLHSLLVPHNQHLSLIPIAIYKVLFHVVGLNHYGVFRIVLVALGLATAALVFVLVSRRLGSWAALIAAALLLFMGASWPNMIWAFQMDYMLSVTAGVAAWVLLDRHDRIGDLGAMAASLIALGSSGVGIPVAIGVAAELAWRRDWRRLWVAVAPALLYLIWYTQYGSSALHSGSETHAVGWAVDAGAAATGGIVNLGLDWGRPLAVLGLLLVARRLFSVADQAGRGGAAITGISARAVGAAATGLSFWVLTGLARWDISTPDTDRYLYVGGVAIIIFAVEMLRGVRLRASALGAAASVAAVGTLIGLGPLDAGSTGLRRTSQIVKAELGAMQLAAAQTPAAYRPDTANAPQIFAGPYLHMLRSVGSSPADTPAQIAAASTDARLNADRVLREIRAPAPTVPPPGTPSASAPAPTLERADRATVSMRGACLTAVPLGAGSTVTVTAPPGGIWVKDSAPLPVGLWIRRFADPFYLLGSGVPGRQSRALPLASDASRIAWHVQIGLPGRVTVCGLLSS